MHVKKSRASTQYSLFATSDALGHWAVLFSMAGINMLKKCLLT